MMAMVAMNIDAAKIVAQGAGFVLTRIVPTLKGTTHIPLSKDEEEQLANAIKLVFERRLQAVLAVGDDLMALAFVIAMIEMKRIAAASLELDARKAAAAKKAPEGAEEQSP